MSARDRTFINRSGVPVTEIAGILSKTRQAIYRGMAGSENYFGERDLTKIVDAFSGKDPALSKKLRHLAFALYDDTKEIIDPGWHQKFDAAAQEADVAWFICGDFSQFRSSFSDCLGQLTDLIKDPQKELRIFCREQDLLALRLFLTRSGAKNYFFIVCKSVDLTMLPFMVICENLTLERSRIFGVQDGGFMGLSDKEAARVRDMILSQVSRGCKATEVKEGEFIPGEGENYIQRIAAGMPRNEPITDKVLAGGKSATL